MPAPADAKLILETLFPGKTFAVADLARIGAAFALAGRAGIRLPTTLSVVPEFADRSNPTAEEKAAYFLAVLRWFGREVARRSALHKRRREGDAQAKADADAAGADFEETP